MIIDNKQGILADGLGFPQKRSQAVHILETVEQSMARNGKITVKAKRIIIDDRWPWYPKGKQMPGQPHGCYRVPGHGVR